MTDLAETITGNKMLQLRLELASLRQRLREVEVEADKQAIRKLIREKETYYNILAERQRLYQ